MGIGWGKSGDAQEAVVFSVAELSNLFGKHKVRIAGTIICI